MAKQLKKTHKANLSLLILSLCLCFSEEGIKVEKEQ